MAVHAHPDDEAISTGGILAKYGDAGVRTVLVTCTDGSCGDGPDGAKPGEPGHNHDEVVGIRQAELERSCKALGIDHLELLGYPDSGMMGWPHNDAPGSFWSTPVAEAAAKLAELFRRYEPQVVVTYDANGFYGHPDHIQAHRITMAAAELTGIPAKIYFTAVPRSRMAEFRRRLEELGIEPPTGEDGDGEEVTGPRDEWGTPDELVTTVVDVTAEADRKFDSLLAHASQSDNIFFLRLPDEVFGRFFGTESFIRAIDRTGAPVPETDLFAGVRPAA
jgi:LmbE family N-acetylglucosaminyl deacetylase